LRRLDGRMRIRDADIEILRAVPMLAVLPAATIEQLGAGSTGPSSRPGRPVFEQGDAGDRFLRGRVRPCRGGTRRTRRQHARARRGFGEIALLDDRPRTATILASGDQPLCLGVLERPAFLTAVTGYPMSARAGREAVALIAARDAGEKVRRPTP
jgi:CRP-like cAMP-binding protein